MKKLLIILSGIISASVYADNSGVYINANAGANTANNYQFAYSANAGYMFNTYLGLEGGFTGSNSSYWDVAAKGVLPIPVVDIYGRLGMAYINNYSSTGGGLLYGVGIGIPILPSIQLKIEDYAISNANTQNFVMGGLQIKF